MTWRDAKVIARTDWADDLWTARFDVDVLPFSPGQFVNVGLDLSGDFVRRSYSIASAPEAPLELYLVKVEGGALTPHLYELGVGATVRIDDKPYGVFTLEHVPDADVLWLVASGTGLGPYVSMLRSGRLWPRFATVVLVHGARYAAHLGYRDELTALAERRPFRYVPMVTRERHEDLLNGRIPAGLESGVIEKAAGHALDTASHVMLCGNPRMIADTISVLERRGLKKHRTRAPGHISTEKYW